MSLVRLLFAIWCGCLIIPLIANAHGIKNGDFELNDNSWKFRNGWYRNCAEQSFNGGCSATYETDEGRYTPIAIQVFHMEHDDVCRISVWVKTALEDNPFWGDGEPTRTGVTVQFWDFTGARFDVPLDLATQPVYLRGYRGQSGYQGWTKYTGTIKMEKGKWEARIYMHAVRDRVDGRITKIRNATGKAMVDLIEMKSILND